MIRVGWGEPPEPPTRVKRLYSLAVGVKVLRYGSFVYQSDGPDGPAFVWTPPPPQDEPPTTWLEVWERSDGTIEQIYTTGRCAEPQPAP